MLNQGGSKQVGEKGIHKLGITKTLREVRGEIVRECRVKDLRMVAFVGESTGVGLGDILWPPIIMWVAGVSQR